MDRYSIAKNRHKKIVPKDPKVESFGFDSDPITDKQKRLPFRPPPNEESRVGLLYTDPSHLFLSSNVHFYNRTAFLCKSIEPNREICCSQRAVRRIVCPIVIYHNEAGTNFEVRAWVFGNSVFQKLRELHASRSINANDFYLKRTSETFNPWELRSLRHGSLWQGDSGLKERILKEAEPIFKNLDKFLGRDLNLFEIRQLLAEPERPNAFEQPRQRPRPQAFPPSIEEQVAPRTRPAAMIRNQARQDSDDDEFFNQLRASSRPRDHERDRSTEELNRDAAIDLDRLLENI